VKTNLITSRAGRAGICLLLLSATLNVTGCVSTKYKRSPKPSEAVELNLAATTPKVEAVLHSVVVFQGPGSWKKEAYWDEYQLSFVNRTDAVAEIDSVTVADVVNQEQIAGTNPWTLEKISRDHLQKYENTGQKILIGAGLGVAWTIAPSVAYAGAWAGSSTVALAGVTTFFAVPAVVVSSLVMSHHAKNDIAAEFDHRRFSLPLALPGHGIKSGSLFFPVSPGPRNVRIKGHMNGEPFELMVDLAPLAGLHLEKKSGPIVAASGR
jgi:hypothetical protein